MRKQLHVGATFFCVRSLIVCLLVVVSSLAVVGAQSASTGALTGTVTDPTGAVVENAKITLRNSGTEETRTALTDQGGSYRFAVLPPGRYQLTVEAEGFPPVAVHDVTIQITELRSISTQLSVQGVQRRSWFTLRVYRLTTLHSEK